MNTLALNSRLLAIIGRRLPAIYDAIIPRYYASLPDSWNSRLAAVALNPQPLPPDQLGAALGAEFVRAVWLADRFGQDPGRIFADLDDWCPTYPKRLKLPPWWPPIPDPDPHPDWSIDLHLGFAARLAVASLEGTRVGKAIDKAIERSITAIESAAAVKQG